VSGSPADGVSLGRALRASWRALCEQPWPAFGWSAAIALALGSVCCGVGLLIVPWLAMELARTLLSRELGTPIARGFGSVFAGLLLAAPLVLGLALCCVLSAASLSSAGGNADSETVDRAVRDAGLAVLLSLGMTSVLWGPWSLSPLIALDRAVPMHVACRQSVQLLAALGRWSGMRMGIALQLVTWFPAELALALVLLSPEHVGWALAEGPALGLSIALGHGARVWLYAQMRGLTVGGLVDEHTNVLHASVGGAGLALMLVPLAVLCVIASSLAWPSPVSRAVKLTSGPRVLDLQLDLRASALEKRVFIPGSALELVASPRGVSVVAADGGAVGALPLASPAPIQRVRVVRATSGYAIALRQTGQWFETRIDPQGVRLDDDLRTRLWAHVRPAQLGAVFAALIAIWLGSALLVSRLPKRAAQ